MFILLEVLAALALALAFYAIVFSKWEGGATDADNPAGSSPLIRRLWNVIRKGRPR